MSEVKPVRCGCGGEAKAWEFMNGKWFVKCMKCAIGQMLAYPSEAEAVAAWNTAMGAKDIDVLDKEFTAHWIATWTGMQCSACGFKCETTALPDVCPSCGSRMVEDE